MTAAAIECQATAVRGGNGDAWLTPGKAAAITEDVPGAHGDSPLGRHRYRVRR